MRSRKGGGPLGVILLLFALLLALAWWRRADLVRLWAGEPEPTEVSEAAAAGAEAKLRRLQEEHEPVRLNEVEIASLLRYRTPAWVTGLVRQPSVELAVDTVRFSGMVPTSRLPSNPDLDRVRSFLPDSTRLDVVGQVRPIEPGRVALEVVQVKAAGLPIPERYYPQVLERIGRRDEPGLAPTALAVQLPPGVGSVRVEADHLVLMPGPRE